MAKRISRAKQRIRDAGARFELPAQPRARRAAQRGPARAVPDLQRGLHDQLGPGAAPHRPDHRGDPAHPAAAPPAPRRGRGRRAARADAAHRRPPRGPHRRRRAIVPSPSSDATCGTPLRSPKGWPCCTATLGTGPVGPYQLQAAIAALHDEAASAEADRLAADPRAVRGARPPSPPGRSVTLSRAVAVASPRPAGRARAARHPRRRRADGAHPPPRSGTRPPARASRRHRCRPRRLPAGGDA